MRRAAVGWAAALCLALPVDAAGHAALIGTSPARRATRARAPERVELRFNERLEPAFAAVSVHAAGGRRVDAGDARVDPGDPRRLSVGLPALPGGAYTVRYRVLSVDGHVAQGEYRFTIKPAP